MPRRYVYEELVWTTYDMDQRHLPREFVVAAVAKAITGRTVLHVVYQHKGDGEVVEHRIAPFDIGSSDPTRAEYSKDLLFTYSFTAINRKTQFREPGMRTFSLLHFMDIRPLDEHFDETDLAIKMKTATFDYRHYMFAFMSERDWFGR